MITLSRSARPFRALRPTWRCAPKTSNVQVIILQPTTTTAYRPLHIPVRTSSPTYSHNVLVNNRIRSQALREGGHESTADDELEYPQLTPPQGKHLSYQRGKRNTNPGTSLIKIEGVDDPKAASFYLGKKIAFVYRGKREIRGTKIRVIWGKVTRPHGNSGLVRAQFKHNLPPKSFGAMVRIMLYPSSV
ncbi:60S ribosomal protein L33B [Elasticomyces elasticus]|uniref:60S ribosomal protein L33B n=1 Tax=Elasticomyces elasticus TaxID=574655 RepID=A0AAN7VXG9_9PEZI|nr:60S ribosomal protein L33B [Elasticomyces elasticus]